MTPLEYIAYVTERQKMLREIHGVKEPIWETQGNKQSIPLSKIEDDHLQEIERMLRGDGWPWVDVFLIAEFWYEIIDTEMSKRGLVRLEALPQRRL